MSLRVNHVLSADLEAVKTTIIFIHM